MYECFYQTENFINTATHREIINLDMSNYTFGINNVSFSKRHSTRRTFCQHTAISSRNRVCLIRDQRILNFSYTPQFSVFLLKFCMRLYRIYRATHNFTTDSFKFIYSIRELNNFCWADKRKIYWIEEKHHIFTY